MLSEGEVIAIAATEGNVGEGEMNLGGQRITLLQLVGSLDAS